MDQKKIDRINELARNLYDSCRGDVNEALRYLYNILNEPWSDKKRV